MAVIGKLVIANPQYTLNMDEAKRSLDKIKVFGAKKVICYHGGILLTKP
jgi:hypothetical protein